MATRDELEAVVEANPDDVDAYHVLADYLLDRGDPRGELIALQAAAHRDPGDRRLAARAARWLAAHPALAVGEGVVATWRHGFVRDARVAGVAAMVELLRHPSGRFVQSLVVADEPDAVVAALRGLGRPQTLADLRVAGLADAQVAALRVKFPRLARSLDVEWRATLAAIAAERKLEIRFAADALPALDRLAGVADDTHIPIDAVLRGLRLELDKERGPGIVAVLRRTFSAESLDRFVVALARQHVERGHSPTTRWAWRAVAALGGARAAAWIGEAIVGWHARALHAIDTLAELPAQHGVIVLAAIAHDPRHELEHRGHAQYRLRTLADARRLDVEALLDRSIPAKLGPRGHDVVVRRLQAQMIDGRRNSMSTFRHHVASHPAVAPLAARLVWAVYDGPRVLATFRLAEDGAVVDADGKPIGLPGGALGVLHPAELADGVRAEVVERWRHALAARAIEPLFPQLARPVRAIAPGETRSGGLDRVRAVLEHQRGWEPQSGYELAGWKRRFARDAAFALVTWDGGALGGVAAVDVDTSAPIAVGRLHLATQSEVLADLDAATAPAPAGASGGPIGKGARVEIVRGRDRGKHGIVFWVDASPAARCGVRGDDGETYWADVGLLALER